MPLAQGHSVLVAIACNCAGKVYLLARTNRFIRSQSSGAVRFGVKYRSLEGLASVFPPVIKILHNFMANFLI